MPIFKYNIQNTSDFIIRSDNSNHLFEYKPDIDILLNLEDHASENKIIKVQYKIIPLKPWQPAKKETLEKYGGILSKRFPKLAELDEETMDKIILDSESFTDD